MFSIVGKIFSDYCALKQSFQRERAPRPPVREGAPKEETRAQTEEDKDIDSSETRRYAHLRASVYFPPRKLSLSHYLTHQFPEFFRESLGSVDSEFDDGVLDQTPDVDALRRSYNLLFELEEQGTS